MEALHKTPCENGGENRAREAGNALLAEFIAYLKALHRDPTTIAAYGREVGQFLQRLTEKNIPDARGARRADLEAYQADLMTCGRYMTNTVHVKMRSVRRFYDWLEKTGKILLNPTAGFRLPKLQDRLPRDVLTAAEVRRLLDAPDTSHRKGVRDKAMLEVFYSTGIRVGELCGLTIYDADLNNGFLRVNQGKGGKDRIVPLGHTAARYVKEYLRHVRGHLTRKKRDERALFVGQRGGFTPSGIEGLVRRYAKAAQIEKRVTPHTLRHTCATHMLAGGADIVHVQHLLGHEDIGTTQIYARVARRDVKATHGRAHPREHDAAPGAFQPIRKFR
jgi:integrase/recombinase XerD